MMKILDIRIGGYSYSERSSQLGLSNIRLVRELFNILYGRPFGINKNANIYISYPLDILSFFNRVYI